MKEKSLLVHSDKKIRIGMGNGIVVKTPSFSIALDPKRPSTCDYTFVSHAHIDHVHCPDGKSKVLASEETARLANIRGFNLGATAIGADGIELFDSGHILGSRGILLEDSVFYTGDLSMRSRGFLRGSMGTKCDTLIMETTYGDPRYVFPEIDVLVQQVNCLIARCFDVRRPVILTGYALGKAQLISYLFQHWDPAYAHESVHEINSAHIDLGVRLRTFKKFKRTGEMERELSRGPWVMISPSSYGRSDFVGSMMDRYNAVVATFTGWSVSSGFRYSRRPSEHAFPISDHCDYNELIELAKYCNPSKIYTVHGFAEEFAVRLRSMGFDAEPLLDTQGQMSISDYA